MSESTSRLSEAVEARKRATWSAVEAQVEGMASRRRSVRVALAGVALVVVAAVAARMTQRAPSRSLVPANDSIVIDESVHDTKHIVVVRGGPPTARIERVGGLSGRPVIATLGDSDMLAFLNESGLPATLIRIGDEVQIAVHDPLETRSGRGRELPADGPASLDEGVQNF